VTSPPAVLRRPDRFYDGDVFDLDGTVHLGKALLPGAGEVIASIRKRGCRTVFLSNNPTRDPQMYADKLGGLGIATSIDDIVNPVVTVPRWLVRTFGRIDASDESSYIHGDLIKVDGGETLCRYSV